MNEKLLSEIFSEKQEVPDELKKRIHAELVKQEKAIMIRNVAIALTAVFVSSFFLISFAIIFLGDIIFVLFTAVFSLITALMASALAVAAGKYEIRNIQKGLS